MSNVFLLPHLYFGEQPNVTLMRLYRCSGHDMVEAIGKIFDCRATQHHEGSRLASNTAVARLGEDSARGMSCTDFPPIFVRRQPLQDQLSGYIEREYRQQARKLL
ncbi:MAG TPA: hypothetical protein VGI28_04605, partial [Stellaceae bacterium]